MSSFRQEFDTRVTETEAYFGILERLDSAVLVEFEEKDGKRNRLDAPSELLKTMKGASFLLLYNLVESTMRNGIVAIFDELKSKKVSFDDARDELRVIALKNIRAMKAEKLSPLITTAATDLLVAAFRPDELFEGNIDARKIRETAGLYGFSGRTTANQTDGLLTVKTNRNDLSHGDKSFEEVGRERSVEELLKIKAQVVHFLRDIIKNIEEYISGRQYLAAPPASGLVATLVLPAASVSEAAAPIPGEAAVHGTAAPAQPIPDIDMGPPSEQQQRETKS